MPAPQPAPDPDSIGFWESADKGAFSLQQCADCANYMFPPLELCRKCGGKLSYKKLSGDGEVYSFIVQHHAVTGGFEGKMPYVIAIVAPKEAPLLRIPTRIVDIEPSKVRVGDKVKAKFERPEGAEHSVVVFAPA
jgi:uncharacterized protein